MDKYNARINYIYNVIYSILTLFLPFVTAPYVSRVVGANGLGIYSYNNTVVTYFTTFALLGVNFYGNRSIAKVRDDLQKRNMLFSEIYIMQLVTSLFMVVLYVLYILFFVEDNQIIAMIMILQVLSPVISVSWFFNGLEMFKVTVTRNLILKLLTVISTFVFVKDADDLWKYALILSIGTLCSEGYLILIIRKYTRFSFPNIKKVLQHIKPNIILFIPILAVSVYRSMDKLMIKWLIDYKQVGYYTNAEKIINICLSSITALGQVMLPKMTNLLSKGENGKFHALLNKSLKLVSVLAFAMLFGLSGIAKSFVSVFFGDGYDACVPIIKLLALNLILLAWGNVLKSEYLIPKEKDGLYIISVAVGAIVNFFINLILIPRMFAVGAAIGTLCAELISILIIFLFVRKELRGKNILADNLPYLVIGLVMYFVISCIKTACAENVYGLLTQVIVGVAVYLVLLYLYWHYTHDEFEDILLDMINKVINKVIKKGKKSDS